MCYICNDNELEFNMSVSVVDSIAKSKWCIIGENVPVCNTCYGTYKKIMGIVGDVVPVLKQVEREKLKARAKSKRRRADNTSERDDEIYDGKMSNLEKAWKANIVDVNCPECGMLCKSKGGLGNHMLHKHGVAGKHSKTDMKSRELYDTMREKQEKLVHYPVYECRWFGEDTENTAEAKCGCVKSKTAKGHTELLAHEKHSHSKKFHPISEEFRKTTYRSRKIQA